MDHVYGLDWYFELKTGDAQDVDARKFVSSCYSKVARANPDELGMKARKNKIKLDLSTELSKPRECSLERLVWKAVGDDVTRIVIRGDSLLCVSWANAAWPVYASGFKTRVDQLRTKIWSWQYYNMHPNADYGHYLHHVYREFNSEVDSLAGGVVKDGDALWTSDLLALRSRPRYVLANFDGSYKHICASGFIVRAAWELNDQGDPDFVCIAWRRWESNPVPTIPPGDLQVNGQTIYNNAVNAECSAVEGLVEFIDNLRRTAR